MTQYPVHKNIVVYADDDPDDIELVEEAFRRFAHNVEVVTFQNGSLVLSYLKHLSEKDSLPCLVILDINMPVLSGKETLVRLRQMEKFEKVPVILFTTSSMPVDKTFAQRNNAGFMTKPLDFEQMELITQRFIEHCTKERKAE